MTTSTATGSLSLRSRAGFSAREYVEDFVQDDRVTMFLHILHPSPIAFQIGPISIYWYGLLIVVAIFIGLALTFRLSRIYKIPKEKIWDFSFYLIIFGLIGARVFYLFYNWPYYWQNQLAIFRVWEGGLSIHGAIAAGILVLFFYALHEGGLSFWHRNFNLKFRTRSIQGERNPKRSGGLLNFWLLADLLAPALALGQAIGRWGNYFNQELYGLPTNLPWGIPIDLINRTENYASFGYFHPTFLYESIWCFIIFLVLLFLHKLRIKENKKHYQTLKYGSKPIVNSTNSGFTLSNFPIGFIFLTYLILYSLGRFFIEFLRIDPQPIIFGFRLGQIFSLIILAGALAIMLYKFKNRNSKQYLK